MSNQNTSIHDFDVNIIIEYYSNFERQGPGSPELTQKALSFIPPLSSNSKVADIGCGTGGQTLELARHTNAQITGIDLSPVFIDIFNGNVQKANLSQRVRGVVESMKNLSFQPGELDLIWCEGAIYNIGFERGLQEWRQFLKDGGFIAISEASWFTNERPDEINRFWVDAYPEIDTIPNKVAQMQNAGYLPVATFVVPDYCWTDNFFAPQVKVQNEYLDKYKGNKAIEGFIANQQHEAVLYKKYHKYYGYVFYIGKKM